jgi:acetyl esterase/lipase
VGLTALALGLVAAVTARADAVKPAKEPAPALYEVQVKEDLFYVEGKDADKVRHKLDVYIPQGRKDFPVLFFVHGGAWTHGDKYFFGVYKTLGTSFARRGIGTVVPNYRLSPSVKHPEHIKDVAKAFAWTHKHIAEYGGRPDQILVCGHSAGGHLVALLATDPAYLKAEGLALRDIRGAIPISGVYRIPPDLGALNRVFGGDANVRDSASPTWQVEHWQPAAIGKDVPPFLIVYGEKDLLLCGKDPAEGFRKALGEQKCFARTIEGKGRNHMTVLLAVTLKDDPVCQAVFDFIDMRTKPKETTAGSS